MKFKARYEMRIPSMMAHMTLITFHLLIENAVLFLHWVICCRFWRCRAI